MTPDEERFVERLEAGYRPPPMSGADVTRFDARLASRRRRRPRFVWLGAAAAMAAAVVLALGLWRTTPEPGLAPDAPAMDWIAALTFDDLDVNPFDSMGLDATAALENDDSAYTIETDWPVDFDGLTYLIEPIQKEI
jgi:hypothetical protein